LLTQVTEANPAFKDYEELGYAYLFLPVEILDWACLDGQCGPGGPTVAIGMVKHSGKRAAANALAAFPRTNLHGVSLKWLKRNKPNGWTSTPTRGNEGFIWKDTSGVERLRFMRPSGTNPANSQWSRQASGYFRWQDAAGNFLDASGNAVPTSHPQFQELTHIIYEGPL
jgi:hypothetical protein